MKSKKGISKLQWVLFGFWLMTTLAMIAGGGWYYHRETQTIRARKYNELKAIAGLKCNQIAAWRLERLADASMNASGIIRTDTLKWRKEAANDLLKTALQNRLQFFRQHEGYENMLLVSPDGGVLLSLESGHQELDRSAKELIARSLASRAPVFGDFFRCPSCSRIHLDVAAPIYDENNQAAAVLILRSDPEKYLYPLIQSWPTPSKSAETLIVRKDGDEARFLNTLRQQADAALKLRVSLAQSDRPAVQAALGRSGSFAGRDYRGVEVVADIRPVPDSPWIMVAKVDASEIFAEARYRGVVILLFVVLAIVMTGFMAAFVIGLRRKSMYKSLLVSERERRKALEEFRATLRGIGDGVIATDTEGRVRRMNPVAEHLTGWSEDEALGRPLEEIFRIINEETGGEVENPVARVLRENRIVGLANHTVLIARDGARRPIADSGAPIRDDDSSLLGVVLVFRDQTDELAAQRALCKSEALFRHLFTDGI